MENTFEVNTGSRYSNERGISIYKVNDLFEQVLADHDLLTKERPYRRDNNTVLSYEAERTFTISGTVYLRLANRFFEDKKRMDYILSLNPKLTKELRELKPKVEISWGSTTRDLANAMSAVDLYRRLVEAGADIQSRLSQYDFILMEDSSVGYLDPTPENTTDQFQMD